MSLYAALSNPDTVLSLFEVVQTGILVIDKDYQVVLANETAGQILGSKPNCLGDLSKCHELFFNQEEPCLDCPIFDDEIPWPKKKSIIIKNEQGSDVFVKVSMVPREGYTVLNLNDVTRELTLIRNVDLTKRELKAQNILLERKQQEINSERSFLAQLLDHLPDALVTVNSSFSVDMKNSAVKEILPHPDTAQCYEMLGNEGPCEGCPAENGFAAANGLKKSHIVEGQYYTEIFTKAHGNNGLLLFRNTTRQIQLIEQIRDAREALSQKNTIFRNLIQLQTFIQQETDSEKVLDSFFDLLLPVINTSRAVAIINDIRDGSIWQTYRKDVDEEQLKEVTRAYLSRDVQTTKSSLSDVCGLPWEKCTLVDLTGTDMRRVGVVLLPCEYNDEETGLIHLFTEPFGANIQNRLLMRQLEEKANKDPLTGLFNRGYLDRAIEEERDKLDKFGIHYSVVMADVNGLKKANDVYGHEAGDKLILEVSRLMNEQVRSTDIVARTGGDEFIILLTNSTDENSRLFVSRLNEKVFSNAYMSVGDDEQFPVSVSLGTTGSDKYDPEIMMKEADRLMYAAKEAYYETRPRYR